MADEKPVGRHGAEHRRFRVFVFALLGIDVGVTLEFVALGINQADVADAHILDVVAGDSADDAGERSLRAEF